MVDLNAHEAGNGGQSQGKPTTRGVLLYSETVFQIPGLQTTDKRELGWPLILIDGFAQIGAPNNFEPHGYRDPTRDYMANLSWNKGSHNLRFGTDINFQDINESQ